VTSSTRSTTKGDRVPDFSNVGYKGGLAAIPVAPARVTLSPVSGDDGGQIQNAINQVAVLASTRFCTNNLIDARNGGTFAANASIPYAPSSTYHFRLVVSVPSRTYSIYVRPPGGSEITFGTNYAFRTEQAGVTSLNNWNIRVNQTGTSRTNKVCNFWTHP
jgi:hypothetical protein